MPDVFTITLPKETPKSDVQAIQETIRQLDSVKGARPLTARGVDPQTIKLMVEIVSGALVAITSAIPLIKGAVDQIRKKGVSGATIELPNGVKISVDNASPADIERLVRAAVKS